MQKFVVAKKFTYPERHEIIPPKVQMSGYLKKKRSKVGGWRKLWFVLQNQLLLSYSSKDEYEKKLGPFKDVLNLVPGTIVRQLGGSRFTIETTTNVIYNFRCDDINSCTEWISALIESLTMQVQSTREIGYSPKFHISLDNIRQMKPKRPVRSSCSWDSICRAKKSAKIPIAQTTARILERNGLSALDINRIQYEEHLQKQQQNDQRAPRNFRLHEENLVNQSDDVSRINQMFIRPVPLINQNSDDRRKLENRRSCTSEIIFDKMENCDIDRKMLDNLDTICCNSEKCFDKRNSRDLNQNRMIDDKNTSSLEGQVQKLTLNLDKSACPNSVSSVDTQKDFKISTISTTSTVYGGEVDTSLPYTSYEAQTKVHNHHHHPTTRLSASTDNINKMIEPIYAVVDLKNKYARRARIREMEEQMEKERPKSVHVVTSDYEEVLNFSSDFLDKDEDENENIYEPIHIPEGIHQRHPMWKYFPRINIDALIEMTKNKKKEPKIENQSTFFDIRKKLGNHRKSIKTRMKKFCTRDNQQDIVIAKERNAISDDELDSQGATGGSTSGTSDNSIKSSCGHIDKPTASFVFNEIEKYRRGEKQIFGSLSRLKKGRTSLCLEDDDNDDGTSKKKLLVSQKSACFQHELRKEITRRSGSKKVPCHSSTFYD